MGLINFLWNLFLGKSRKKQGKKKKKKHSTKGKSSKGKSAKAPSGFRRGKPQPPRSRGTATLRMSASPTGRLDPSVLSLLSETKDAIGKEESAQVAPGPIEIAAIEPQEALPLPQKPPHPAAPQATPHSNAPKTTESPQPPQKAASAQSRLFKEVEPIVQRGDAIGLKLKLEDAATLPSAYVAASKDKGKNVQTGAAHLKSLLADLNYQALALAAASFGGDAAFLADPLLKKSREAVELLPFVLKAAKGKKHEVYGLVADFEKILDEFDQMVHEKVRGLKQAGDAITKTLAQKDFAQVCSLAEIVLRDSEILAQQFDMKEIAASQESTGLAAAGTQEKWTQIDKQVIQLSQSLLAKQYRHSADLSKLVAAGSGVMGDQAFAKAIELIGGGRQLLQAFREQKVALVGKMATSLSRQAGIFNAPLMARSNQLSEQIEQLDKLERDKDYEKFRKVTSAICRTSALLSDPTIKKASMLSGDLSKVDVYVKRKDFAAAVSTLSSSLG